MGDRLRGKVVVVTGGTKGIGKAVATMAASEGARVVVHGRSEEDGRRVVRDIAERYGSEALFVQGDVGKEEDCGALIDKTVERFGRVDGLVNNAGIFPRGTMTDTTGELFDAIFSVNMKGSFFCSKYAILSMQRTGGGSIVQMGSTNAYRGSKDLAAYSCSKGAMLTLNRHIAAHYARDGIRSNCITVGWVATEGELELQQKHYGRSPEELNDIAARAIGTGRMQTPEDIAHSAIFLLSDDASQVTGTEMMVNGGLGL